MGEYVHTSAEHSNGLLAAALEYARRGIIVFPCKLDKSPYWNADDLPNGFKNATTSFEQITTWWTRWPNALIGAATGWDFTVLDLDRKNGKDGLAVVPDWQQRSPLIACTASGGRHLYSNADKNITCTSDEIALGVDTRGIGGYVIVPPSAGYSWENGNSLLTFDLSQLPAWPADLRLPIDSDEHVAGEQISSDDELVALAVSFVPNPNLGWDAWNRIGMAIYGATGGSDAGRQAFHAFSERSKYRSSVTDDRWSHYHKSHQRALALVPFVI
jgi:hypothetical protein